MEKCGAVWVTSYVQLFAGFGLMELGHCFLMMEDLQQAYAAYQQALYHLRNPKVSVSLARLPDA